MKNKLLYFFLLLNVVAFSQTPSIQWFNNYQNSIYCGSEIYDIQQTSDGGYVGAGKTCENFYIIKIDQSGNKEWDVSLGGSGTEIAKGIQQTSDGGFIVIGQTDSPNDGDVYGGHGGVDFWVVKLNSNGVIQWSRCFGGYYNDFGINIKQISDGNYIVSGYLETTGTINGYGGYDYYIIKLNNLGNIIWQNIYGGNGNDELTNLSTTADGGYILSGRTLSSSGLVTGNNGGYDAWIVKIDSNGILQWQKNIGGSDDDCINYAIETLGGNYLLVGYTISNDIDAIGNHGQKDFWVIKMNSSGNVIWKKCYGGSLNETAKEVHQTNDGNYIIIGDSKSTDGDILNNNGLYDFWLIKINETGDIIWNKSLGDNNSNYGYSIKQTSDQGYIISGASYISVTLGFTALVYKLTPENLSNLEINKNPFYLFPNPSSDEINIIFSNNFSLDSITIFDEIGNTIFNSVNPINKINLKDLCKGVYFADITSGKETHHTKIIKN